MPSTKFLVEKIDFGNAHFRRCWSKLDPKVLAEATERVAQLMRQTSFPAGLHVHQLKEIRVKSALSQSEEVPVWTMHITADDTHKASFTIENCCAYFRTCGKHDHVDKKP